MALRPQNNEAFLREVDEELRRDELTRFWKRYGIAVGVLVVLALAAFAGWLIWKERSAAAAGREGQQLSDAIEQLSNNQTGPAKAALQPLTTSEVPGYRAAAKMASADVALQDGKLDEAVSTYQSIATDEAVGQPYRDAALVRATAAEFDRLPPATVVQRLQGLARPDSPWFGSAGEMVAMAQLAQGQREAAGRLFTQLANTATVPASIRSRAVQMASLVETAPAAAAPAAPARPTQEPAR